MCVFLFLFPNRVVPFLGTLSEFFSDGVTDAWVQSVAVSRLPVFLRCTVLDFAAGRARRGAIDHNVLACFCTA